MRWDLRSWVLSHEAAAEVDRAVAEMHRIEEQLMGVEWFLVRNPGAGDQVTPDSYVFVNRRAASNAALITVLYEFDENEVKVMRLWIR
jgi:hypothetical protein